MNKRIMTLLTCWLVVLVGANGQTPATDAPAPPNPPKITLIKKVPDNTTWKVKVMPSEWAPPEQEERTAPDQPTGGAQAIDDASTEDIGIPADSQERRQIVNTYSNGVRREVISNTSGTPYENYIIQGTLVYVHPKTGEPAMVHLPVEDEPGDNAGRFGEFVKGFSAKADELGEFAWVKLGHFTGEVIFMGEKCRLFMERESGPSLTDPNADESRAATAGGTRKAYFRVVDGYPLALETPDAIRLYSFEKSSEMKPPSAVTAYVEKIQRRTKAFYQRYAIPN
jgi:hypothetical protein